MEWIEIISSAVEYIEDRITEDISVNDIADHVNISPFYFQKAFSFLCEYTPSEYIRRRRLALAGIELASADTRIIDIALKYGYDSPDSFTRAFSRFHGVTPSAARKDGAILKSFAPLKIKLILEGGYLMDYKIVKKDSFTVIGSSKQFKYENAKEEIPKFWKEHFASGNGKYVCGMYGINHDETMKRDEFEYIIADDYKQGSQVPEGFVTKEIPSFTWAVFPCVGPMPKVMQEVSGRIFSEWLPSCRDYEIAAGYCVEMYDDTKKYADGTQDEKYYSEIWVPVKKK